MVIVDRDLTFGKRDTLTLEGDTNVANVKPTSHILIFENKNQSKQIIIRISFTNSFVGNDMLDWSTTNGYPSINSKLAKTLDMATLSYKNLIITIQQLSKDEVDSETTRDVIRKVIKMIEKY